MGGSAQGSDDDAVVPRPATSVSHPGSSCQRAGSVTALAGGQAALTDQAHLEETRARILAGRTWLSEQLQELDLKIWPSQANFILVEFGPRAEAVVDYLLEQDISVRPAFDLPGYIRISVGLPEANQALIKHLKNFLASR